MTHSFAAWATLWNFSLVPSLWDVQMYTGFSRYWNPPRTWNFSHVWFQTIFFIKPRFCLAASSALQGALHPVPTFETYTKKWMQKGGANSQRQDVKLLCFPTFGAWGHGWFYCVWWPQSCVFLACDSWNSWIQSGSELSLWQFSAWTLQGWQRFVLSLLRSLWCDSLVHQCKVLCEVIMTSEKRPAPNKSTKEESE